MRCPQCESELACGWWCNECKTTKDRAAWLAFAKRSCDHGFEPLIVLGGFFAVLLLAYLFS